MDDTPVTTLRFGVKHHPDRLMNQQNLESPLEHSWRPKPLQTLLEEDERRPTLRERLENWGSD